jgi:hypothetical protein
MIVPTRRQTACLTLAAAIALSGCSSSAKKGDTGANSAPASASSGGGAPDSATTRAITSSFKIFFDTNTSLDDSVAVLQHGPTFRKTLDAESNSPAAKDITAIVSKVKVQSANVAMVTFTIKTGAQDLLPNTHGYAVREGGKWKVAAQTFCSLLTLEGTAPPACKDSSITALPD